MTIKISRTQAQQAAERPKRSASSANWWKPEAGVNHVRIFAFNRADKAEGDEDRGCYHRPLRVHTPPNQKPTICGFSITRDGRQEKGRCPECDEVDRIRKEKGWRFVKGKKQNDDPAGRISARNRIAFLVCPIRVGGEIVPAEEHSIKVWWAASTAGEAILAKIADEDVIPDPSAVFGVNGLNFKVQYDPNAAAQDMYRVEVLSADKSVALDPALQAQAQALDLYADDGLEPAWFLDAKPAKAAPAPAPAPAAAPRRAPPAPASTVPQTETLAYWKAYLDDAGLSADYTVEMFKNEDTGRMAPVFYRLADGPNAEGSWEAPKPAKKVQTPEERGFKPAPKHAQRSLDAVRDPDPTGSDDE